MIILFPVFLFLLICFNCWLGWWFRRGWGTKTTIPEENVVHKFPDVASFHGIAIVNSAPPSGQSCDSIWSQFRNRFWVRSEKNIFFFFIERYKIHCLISSRKTNISHYYVYILLVSARDVYSVPVRYMFLLVYIEKNAISHLSCFLEIN